MSDPQLSHEVFHHEAQNFRGLMGPKFFRLHPRRRCREVTSRKRVTHASNLLLLPDLQVVSHAVNVERTSLTWAQKSNPNGTAPSCHRRSNLPAKRQIF